MALNKYMHPRNIYRTPPNFMELSKIYREFSDICKLDVTGKITLDFKDPHSLRILTKCLLKHDFNIDVDIPKDRLVPTLPLRLNYVLWIEDLLKNSQQVNDIRGIDIGTGACAIYPLLGAVKNKWHMLGTETDEESFLKAQHNVEKNHLQDLITLKRNLTSNVIDHVFADVNDKIYNFCMCNPPFYCNVQELYESRSAARPPPKNGFTGSPQELITEGGELEFCRKLMAESKLHKDRVMIFSTMVGHKYNLKELLQDLKSENVKYTHTEFCQGRVTRWGLAWTYQDYDLYSMVPPRDTSRKKNVPVSFTLPEITQEHNTIDLVTKKLKSILQELNINYKIINKRGASILMDVTAYENTWSNQRRKRRLNQRIQENEVKKAKLNSGALVMHDDESGTITKAEANSSKETNDFNNSTSSIMTVQDCSSKDLSDINTKTSKPVVHAILKVVKRDNYIIEMEHLDGSLGKVGIHQIMQYIKNNYKQCVFDFLLWKNAIFNDLELMMKTTDGHRNYSIIRISRVFPIR